MKTLLNLRNLRRAIQILSLAIIVALFLATEYRGQDTLPYPVGLLFRLDPLAALAAAFAPGSFPLKVLWPALGLILLTALFGRFFCGWICPLGTTLDGCGKALGRGPSGNYPGRRRIKYYLLVFLVAGGFFGVQLFGLFDPLAIFL
ncbi:MAG TPA: 4Fe-4S binding protein, partial [Deferrimonas sp.]